MALKPANHWLLVTPSGDNSESERRDRLIVVQNDHPQAMTYRGVVDAVGDKVEQDIARGNIAHYVEFTPLFDRHLVHESRLLAMEDDE